MTFAIWITGPPASGKSAVARRAAERLAAAGHPVRVLELDEIREVVTPQPSYTDLEREIVYRALAYMAKLLVEAGTAVIIDATAHRRAWRDLARRLVPRFGEVALACPPEVRVARERTRAGSHAPKGIYARSGEPDATVPGVNVPYEPPLAPELRIDTSATDVETAAGLVAELAERLGRATPPPVPAPPSSPRSP